MIGVTNEGRVKVWLNENFAKHDPETDKIDHIKGEAEFIRDLVRVAEEHIDYHPAMVTFGQFMRLKWMDEADIRVCEGVVAGVPDFVPIACSESDEQCHYLDQY
jgi:hypothetical protein